MPHCYDSAFGRDRAAGMSLDMIKNKIINKHFKQFAFHKCYMRTHIKQIYVHATRHMYPIIVGRDVMY